MATEGYCNYLVPSDEAQSLFVVKVDQYDKLVLRAIVDQEWGTSEDVGKVGPSWAVNNPQTHFVRLRQSDTYHIEN